MSRSEIPDSSWSDIKVERDALVGHLPEDQFLKKLLKGVTRVARDKCNPIRGNLAASGLREIVGHVLHSLAPDEEVKGCVWFKQAPDTKTVTRRQRANYIVHAGLPDKFVKETLNLDVQEHVQSLLKTMGKLHSKAHVQAETILYEDQDVRGMIQKVLFGLRNLLDAAAESRERVEHALAEVVYNAILDNLILNTIQELDELSSHTSVRGHHIDTIEVREMTATKIGYHITGEVETELQYGSNSDVRNDMGFRQDASYPYSAMITSSPREPLEIYSDDVTLEVDTRGFFK